MPYVEDHKHNKFNSINEMCMHYNISSHVYRHRIKAGYSTERALTLPVRTFKTDKQITDHLGNTFKSKVEMCKHYNISFNKYGMRIRSGWSQKDALTKQHAFEIQDHKGNTFDSINEMCKAYGISRTAYAKRIKENWPLEKILKTKHAKAPSIYAHTYPVNLMQEVFRNDIDINAIQPKDVREFLQIMNRLLPLKHIETLELRYRDKKTLREIAGIKNVSAAYIGQSIKYSCGKIRKSMLVHPRHYITKQ